MRTNNRFYVCDDYDFSEYNKILEKYFNITKFTELSNGTTGCAVGVLNDGITMYKSLNGDNAGETDSDTRKIYMADGILFGFLGYNSSFEQQCGLLVIDVNGENRGPNTWGRDTFSFELMCDGHLTSRVTPEEIEQRKICSTSSRGGSSCGIKIIADGWKMNY